VLVAAAQKIESFLVAFMVEATSARLRFRVSGRTAGNAVPVEIVPAVGSG